MVDTIHIFTSATINETDVFGNVIGEFKASDYALTLGAGKQLYERLSVGANVRMINSQYAEFDSWGVGFDIAAMYHDTASNFNLTLVARNAGWQLNRQFVHLAIVVEFVKAKVTYGYFMPWRRATTAGRLRAKTFH